MYVGAATIPASIGRVWRIFGRRRHWRRLLPAHPWLPIPGCSSMAAHLQLIISGFSSLAAHSWLFDNHGCSSQTSHPWPFITRNSYLIAHPRLLIPSCPSINYHFRLLVPGSSFLVAYHWLFDHHGCSPLTFSSMAVHPSQLISNC